MARWLGLLFLMLAGGVLSAAEREFTLHAGPHDRADGLVRIALPDELHGAAPLQLSEMASGQEIPVQRISDREAAFILPAPLPAGAARRYRLRAASAPVGNPRVVCSADAALARIDIDGRPVLSYRLAVAEPPAGLDPRYRRSGHIHPVATPSGKIVTDEFPPEHAHQHAIFSAWVNTHFDGRKIDFWNQLEGTGTVEHRRLIATDSGPVCGGLTAELAHVDLLAPGGPRDALLERWTVRAFAVAGGRLFEIESEQRCATGIPLIVHEYHYGGMAARGARGWNGQPEHDFLTSEGFARKEGNHTRPNWVEMHGLVEGKPCGLAVFSHPANFRNPQPVRLHPQMPYFVFSPCVLGEFEIRPGVPYAARYLYFAHDGPPDGAVLKAIWQNYAEPPRVEWVE